MKKMLLVAGLVVVLIILFCSGPFRRCLDRLTDSYESHETQALQEFLYQ